MISGAFCSAPFIKALFLGLKNQNAVSMLKALEENKRFLMVIGLYMNAFIGTKTCVSDIKCQENKGKIVSNGGASETVGW